MTIHAISPTGIALYITPADLSEHGMTPSTLTLAHAVKLARAAFCESGVAPRGDIELEAYPDTAGVLIFAQLMPSAHICFSFPDSESLIRAVQVLPAPSGDGTLGWWDERYWLSLPNDPRCAAILSEFGSEEIAPLCAPRPLLRGNVIGKLKQYFRQ